MIDWSNQCPHWFHKASTHVSDAPQAGACSIWAAVRKGDAAGVRAKLAAGATIDEADSEGQHRHVVGVAAVAVARERTQQCTAYLFTLLYSTTGMQLGIPRDTQIQRET